ncbi:MAG: response regulator transcription factor [Zhaonellaceae bacterium]|nr:response regulator transcription factor [Clostridia bacterium]
MLLHLLVIDDDEKITALLRRSLEFEGYRVTTAADGEKGLALAAQTKPDLVILDLMLPSLDGYQVCQRLRDTYPKIPVLMLTAKDDVKDKVKGLTLGADDYLVKPFALEELLARIKALLRRSGCDVDKKITYADVSADISTREAWRGKRELGLTAKEFDLLVLFLRHPRQVLTREYLMEEIWGYDYSGESNVLEVYIGYLRQKLEAQGESRIIQTVRGVGYALRE